MAPKNVARRHSSGAAAERSRSPAVSSRRGPAPAVRRQLEAARQSARAEAASSIFLPLATIPTPLTSWPALPAWVRCSLARQHVGSFSELGSRWDQLRSGSGPQSVLEPGVQAYLRTLLASAGMAAFTGDEGIVAQRAPPELRATLDGLTHVLRSSSTAQPRDAPDFLGEPAQRQNPDSAVKPRANILALSRAQHYNSDPAHITDVFVAARVLASVRPSTVKAYISALRLIFLFCSLLRCPMIPASRQSIWRFSSLISNESSLRVYLAAWRKAHILAGFWWPCEACLILRDIRRGVRNLMPARGPRPCIRAQRLVALVAVAVKQEAWRRAARYVFAYQFLLRVPSELLRQFQPALLSVDEQSHRVSFGPIQRKTVQNSTLVAPCICRYNAALACAHQWALWVLSQTGPSSTTLFLEVRYDTFIRELRLDLVAAGVSEEEAGNIGSHAFRHGAARDILESSGLRDTMSRGGWQGDGVFHYVPRTEVEAQALAEVWEGLSEEES